MKRAGLFVGLLAALLAYANIASADFLVARNYSLTPPPYEISLWGTGGFLFGTFNAVQGAGGTTLQGSSVDAWRFSWGFDFFFRIWMLGFGFEYSKQQLERVNLDTSTFSDTPATYTLNKAYTANMADCILGKVKLEFFNIIAEVGIGFYLPSMALYKEYSYTVTNVPYNERWSITSMASQDPKVAFCFAIGYPLSLTSTLDVIPYARLNLFSQETSIGAQQLRNIARSPQITTIDLGIKFRVGFN